MTIIKFSIKTNAGSVADVFEAAVVNVRNYNNPPNVDGAPGVSLWDLVYDVMLTTRKGLFWSQGTSEGSSWPGYIAEERRYVLVKSKILGWRVGARDQLRWQPNVKERLFPSLTVKGHKLNIGHLDSARKARSFTFGSKAKGAENHETGTGYAPRWAWPKSGRYQIPQRRILTIGPNTTRKLQQSAIQWAAQFTASIGVKSKNVEGLGAGLQV